MYIINFVSKNCTEKEAALVGKQRVTGDACTACEHPPPSGEVMPAPLPADSRTIITVF